MVNKVQHASEVFLLLKRDYRISRNIRLAWFLDNLTTNQNLNDLPHASEQPITSQYNSPHEIEIISKTIPNDSSVEEDDENLNLPPCLLQSKTRVNFLSLGYRLIFVLDFSPSLFRVNTEHKKTEAECQLDKLAECFHSLLQPVNISGGKSVCPTMYITVMIKTKPKHPRGLSRYEVKVLVQGCRLTPTVALSVLNDVENEIFSGSLYEESDYPDEHMPPYSDQGLVTLIRNAMLSLQVLPSNTSSSIIFFTDAIFGVPDMSVLESILNQLRASTITCSFVKVGNHTLPYTDFGYTSNDDIIELIAKATNGCCIYDEVLDEIPVEKYQKACLVYSFQLPTGNIDKNANIMDIRKWDASTDLRYTPTQKNINTAPILRKKQAEITLAAPLLAILSVRLREGYMVQSIEVNKGIEVKMVLPWNSDTTIEYCATSLAGSTNGPTKVEISIESIFEFLYDVTNAVPNEKWCKLRNIAVKRFTFFVKNLIKSDQILVHLHSFPSVPSNYANAPCNVPLFYRHPNSGKLSLTKTSSAEQMLANYWRTIVTMDVNVWQKWLHTHKIEIVLQHDLPLPKHIHVSSGNGKYSSIQCREAMTVISNFLHKWATFDLLDANSYVKFVYDNFDEKPPPTSFYLLKLRCKAQIVIIRLGFLIGATGSFRNQVLKEIRSQVLALTLRNHEDQNIAVRRSRHASARSGRHASGNERPCALAFYKPIDQILVRYDFVPQDFRCPILIRSRQMMQLRNMQGCSYDDNGLQRNIGMQDIVRYLKHRRWVYSVSNVNQTATTLSSAGQLASKLVEMRLQEGFTFASCSSGIINMIREFTVTFNPAGADLSEVEKYYLLAQYIIFPPTPATSDNSVDESVGVEDDKQENGEILLVAEMWVEPQAGTVLPVELPQQRSHSSLARMASDGSRGRMSSVSSSTSTHYYNAAMQSYVGCKYETIPDVVVRKDSRLVSLLTTIEHLRLLALPNIPTPVPTLPQYDDHNSLDTSNTRKTANQHIDAESKAEKSETFSYFPCLFDLPNLLAKCQRIKMLFTTLSVDTSDKTSEVRANDELFYYFDESLKRICDRKVKLSQADCIAITRHMRERNDINHERDNTLQEDTDPSSFAANNNEGIDWKMYIKVLSEGKLVVLLIPETYKDFEKLLDEMPEYGESSAKLNEVSEFIIAEQNEDESPATPQHAKLSKKSSLPPNSSTKEPSPTSPIKQYSDAWVRKTLPVLVYYVCTNTVQDKYLCSLNINIANGDYIQDHRNGEKPQNVYFTPMRRPRNRYEHRSLDLNPTDSQFKPMNTKYSRSLSQPAISLQTPTNGGAFFSPVYDNVLSPTTFPLTFEPDVVAFCDMVVDNYQRSFVRGVFRTLQLHNGRGVCDSDLQAATDICDESIKELNITQFLLYTSPQIANFKAKFTENHRVISQDETDDVFADPVKNPTIDRPTPRVKPFVRRGSSTSSTELNSLAHKERRSHRDSERTSYSQKSDENLLQTLITDDNESANLLDEDIKHDSIKNVAEGNKLHVDISLTQDLKTPYDNLKSDRKKSAFKKVEKRKRAKTPPSADSIEGEYDKMSLQTKNFANSGSDQRLKDAPGILQRPVSHRNQNVIETRVAWEDLPSFPLTLLSENHVRHLSGGTNEQVERKFKKILSHNFQSLGNGMFFFRGQNTIEQYEDRNEDKINLESSPEIETEDNIENGDHYMVSESDHDIRFAETTEAEVTDDGDKKNGKQSLRSQKRRKKLQEFNLPYDLEKLVEYSDDENYSLSESSDISNDAKDHPLFLSLTCSVRVNNSKMPKLLPVDTLPVSLATLQNCFDTATIQLSDLQITLDLIWVFLHNSVSQTADNERENNEPESPTHVTTPSSAQPIKRRLTVDMTSSEHFKELPSACQEAVEHASEEIEWLLKDEIISSLRTCEPITSSTLQQVSQHIDEAVNSHRENCQKHTVPLQFVYGAATSLQLFSEEFLKQDFKGYRLKKDKDHFYLTIERAFKPIRGWEQNNVANMEKFINDSANYQNNLFDSYDNNSNVKFGIGMDHFNRAHSDPRKTKASVSHSVRSSVSAHSVTPRQPWLDSSVEKRDDIISLNKAQEVSDKNGKVSSHSTPIRKTMSARTLDDNGSDIKPRASQPDLRRKSMGATITNSSRLSLPGNNDIHLSNTPELIGSKIKSSSTQNADLDRSIDAKLFYGSQPIPPIVMRNSPQFLSNPTSPAAKHYSGNSSLSSAGSAPNNFAPNPSSSATAALPESLFTHLPLNSQNASTFVGFQTYNPHTMEKVLAHIPHKEPVFSPLSDTEMRRYSQASFMESDGNGYDGEVESDMEGEDVCMMSMQEGISEMPDFWMIFIIHESKVDIYFQRRSCSELNECISKEHEYIMEAAIQNVSATCKFVNQRLLLKELNDTRMCHSLLVEEPDEEIWRNTNYRHGPQNSYEYNIDDQSVDGYLEASLRFPAGHFSCNCVLEQNIPIHPRLKSQGHSGMTSSSVIATVAVSLRNISVNNRKNMFVYVLSDESIFYCRLEQDTVGKDDSRRSSLLLQAADSLNNSDGTIDRRSSYESLSAMHNLTSDVKGGGYLKVQWHGVHSPTQAQQEELEKITRSISKKLDESALEQMTVMLHRNSKLTPADVAFIQPRTTSLNTTPVPPDATLKFVVPHNFFCGFLPAIKYFTNQNLLQFLNMPRYSDINQNNGQFLLYSKHRNAEKKTDSANLPDKSIFLFYQSHERGKTGYGIACVVLEWTDMSELPLRNSSDLVLLEKDADIELNELFDLCSKVDFEEKILSPVPRKQPLESNIEGCALLHFHIWFKGTLTVEHIKDRLRTALSHSLLDTVTEFFILKNQLCDSQGDKLTEEAAKTKKSEKSEAMRSLVSALNDPSSKAKIFFGFRSDAAGLKDKGNEEAKPSPVKDRRTYVQRLEEGDAGVLNQTYKQTFEEWCEKLLESNSASVFKFQIEATYRRCSLAAISDICSILSSSIPSAKVKLFHGGPGEEAIHPCNNATSECAKQQPPNSPGKYASFCIIARNLHLWRRTFKATVPNYIQQANSICSSLKFLPFDANNRPDQSPRPQEHRMVTPNTNALYLPRQQLVVIRFIGREIIFRSYNLSNETKRSIQNSMKRAIDFQNGRVHVLQCVWAQKSRLRKHFPFEEEVDAGPTTPNQFTRSVKDVDVLLRNQNLPSEQEIATAQTKSQNTSRRPFFNDAFVENRPRRPMQLSNYEKDVFKRNAQQYFELKGQLKKQIEEQQHMTRLYVMWKDRANSEQPISRDALRMLVKCSRLVHFVSTPLLFHQSWRKSLIDSKQITVTPPQTVEEPERGRTKSNSSRKGSMADFKLGGNKSNKGKQQTISSKENATDEPEVIGVDVEGLKRTLLQTYAQYWQNAHFSVVQSKPGGSLKFQRNSSSKNKPEKNKRSSSKQKLKEEQENQNTRYLKRVTTGGIVLVELSCKTTYFQVKLYIMDANRLHNIHQLNEQMAVMFRNDIERYKTYTHLHSFVYDFHIRCVQWYLEGRQSVISTGFHITNFLREFMLFFSRYPSFVRNHVFYDNLEVDCAHVSAIDLFRFLVDKHKLYSSLKPLKMVEDNNVEPSFALVSNKPLNNAYHHQQCAEDEHALFDVGIIIFRDQEQNSDSKTMKIEYYLLFTSRRFVFPAVSFGENLSQVQGLPTIYSPLRGKSSSERRPPPKSNSMLSLQDNSESSTFDTPPPRSGISHLIRQSSTVAHQAIRHNNEIDLNNEHPAKQLPLTGNRTTVVRQLSGGRRQSVPILDDTSKSQHNQVISSSGEEIQHATAIVQKHVLSCMETLITCEVSRTRDYLTKVCANAEKHCYKEQLWSQMINDELSYSKFEELLKFLHRVKISKLDPKTSVLAQSSANNTKWGINLQEQLKKSKKFAVCCRLFTNPHDELRHLVVLNLRHQKMIVLISVDKNGKKCSIEVVMKDELDLLATQHHSSAEASNVAIYLRHLEEVLKFASLQTFKSSFLQYES